MDKLHVKAWAELGALTLAMALLIFIPAGTVRYWQAWEFLVLFVAGSSLTNLYLIRHDRSLLCRRVKAGPTAEKLTTQKAVMGIATVGLAGLLVISALDHRYDWSTRSLVPVVAGNVLVAAGFYIVFLVYRQNTYTSATIEIAADQTVVSAGPYALLRHPMYSGSLLFLLGMPLALGSYWGLAVLVPILGVLIWRIAEEEKLLTKSLPGYAEYRDKVHSRLIPGVF
jgi:protein-S-isoprenylcysteine O-methyltransferase Ste14